MLLDMLFTFFKRYRENLFLLLYCGLFLGLVFLSWDRPEFFNDYNLEHFSSQQKTIFFLSTFSILLLYGLVFLNRFTQFLHHPKKLLPWLIPLVALLALTPPMLSLDSTAYLIWAKNFLVYNQNPYLTNITFFPDNAWLSALSAPWWPQLTFPYGPLFLWLLVPVIFLAGPSLLTAVILLKIQSALLFFLGLFFFSKIVRHYQQSQILTSLFALNPNLLVDGILEGHNDLLLLVSLILGVWFFVSHQTTKSIVWMALGSCIKFLPALCIPFFLASERNIYWKRVFPVFGIFGGLFLLLLSPFGWPLQHIFQNWLDQSQLACFNACSPVIRLVHWITPEFSRLTLSVLAVLTLGIIWYTCAWKKAQPVPYLFWMLCVTVFVLSPALTSWYLLPVIGLGVLLSQKPNYRILTFVLMFYSFSHYFGGI